MVSRNSDGQVSVVTYHLRKASIKNLTSEVTEQRYNYVEQLAILRKQTGYPVTSEVWPAILSVKIVVDCDLLLQKLEDKAVHKNMVPF